MMKSRRFLVFLLMAALALFAGSATAQTCTDRDAMIEAAQAAGVAIYPDQMVSASNDAASVTAATIRGYEQVPPAALARGTDVGFIHLDAPKSGIPAGFYRLHASADPADVRVGKFDVNVDLVDGSGKVVATVPGSADASSLTVPSPLPFARTAIRASVPSWNTNEPQSIIIIIICPNGVIIIIWIPWW
jgi:hypothetical protein